MAKMVLVPLADLKCLLSDAEYMHRGLNEGHGIHSHLCTWFEEDYQDAFASLQACVDAEEGE